MKLNPAILIFLAFVGYSTQQSPCPNNPCKNGATCFFGGVEGSYFCQCLNGFEGDNCENYNVCIGQGQLCFNGGLCISNNTLPRGYECECPAQFEGDRCQTLKVDVCTAQTPCQNGGTCLLNVDLTLGYQCQCAAQFEGTNCQTMITDDVCASSPCVNDGTCFRAFSEEAPASLSYVCVCRPGYQGLQCEEAPAIEVDVCESMQPCLNGGTCYVSSTDDWRYICMCREGYSGTQCQNSNTPNLCLSSNPCQNNSTCVHLTGASSVICQCALGYVGEHCQTIDTGSGACLPNPCMNGGTCNPDPFANMGYTCSCIPTFSGVNCQLEYFGCASNPCQNSGTCMVHTYGTYFCQCVEGYAGRLCENAGPCASSPCSNNGTCMENPQVRDPDVRAYNCICPPGYMGAHCEQQASEDPCIPNPCRSGTCYKSDTTSGDPVIPHTPFICVCPPDTVGVLCDNDPCLSTPCINGGSCNPIFHPVTWEVVAVGCICPTGFTGPTCAVVGPCQSNPCQHGGTCIDSTGSSPDPLMGWDDPIQPAMLAFFCQCTSEWTGTTCSETSDPCASNPCENSGTCVRIESGFTCVCPALYAGARCENRVDPCSLNPCMNSGRCVLLGSSYTCVCPPPYVGSHCERSDPCATAPCFNNGTCFRSMSQEAIICVCADGYEGTYCQEIIDFCSSKPCLNGGTCFTGINSYVCVCTEAYTGTLCSDPVPTTTAVASTTAKLRTPPFSDACQPSPCLNGGTCLPIGTGSLSFTCLCPMHYAGLSCAVHLEPLDVCDPNPCLNGGICVLHTKAGATAEDGYICVCENGFVGNTCALFIEKPGTTTAGPTTPAVPTTTRHTTITPTTTTMKHSTTSQPQRPTTISPTQGILSTTHKVISNTEEVTSKRVDVETTVKPVGTTTYVPQICFHAASVYGEGAERVTDCVKCTCINGEWLCGERNCDCMIDGTRYKNTDTWTMDCNICICNAGVEICTDVNCGTACTYNGVYFVNGDFRQNDCNTCMCEEGDWICTEDTCGDTCLFGGETFIEGEMRKESCNSCFCLKEAQWLCTVRDCEGSPIIISVSFKINYEFAAIENNQQEFIMVFKEDMRKRYNLAKQNLQNVMVFAGSIEVMFDLVEVKDSNVNVEAIASDLQFKIQARNYTLTFQGLDLFADPNSFTHEKLETGQPKEKNGFFTSLDQETIILIAVVACGTLGLIVVVSSVCYFTQHAPRRARTEYGESRLPRASDRVHTGDGFVNNGYHEEGIPELHREDTDNTLPRSYRVINND